MTTTLISEDTQAAVAAATVIEQAVDGDIVFSVGKANVGAATAADILPTEDSSGYGVSFTTDNGGRVALFVAPRLIEVLSGAGDADATIGAAIGAAIEKLQEVSGTALDAAEVSTLSVDEVIGDPANEISVVGLIEGSDRLATLVVRVGPDAGSGASDGDVAPHEFQPLQAAAAPALGNHALELLNDVEMEVTAELGRRRLSVRELLSLTPGAVVELDRAAGSPVDVLVNGTLIARGEVVVIDEEFGIRIAEIVRED